MRRRLHQTESSSTQSQLKLVRRLVNAERMFLRVPYSNISLCAQVKGDICENRLRSALEKICMVHPLVNATVVFDDSGNAWFSTDDVPGPVVRVVPRKSDAHWFREVQHEQSIPFDPLTGPLVRFVLL
jgi:hypothetical protein